MNRTTPAVDEGAVRLSLHTQIDPESRPPEIEPRQLRRWIFASLEASARLTIRFVGRAEARQLNRQFRNHDYPTNVLTFNYDDEFSKLQGNQDLTIQADIVICMDVLVREARAQSKPLKDHLAHLVIHGTLHAQGWDHQTPAQAELMEYREIQLLKRFRIADPYQIPRRRQIGIPGKLRYPRSVETT